MKLSTCTGGGPYATRVCRDPSRVAKLVAKTEDGRCTISHSTPVYGVTVWQTRRAAESGGWGG